MKRFQEADLIRIKAAVQNAEKTTSGEIVPLVVKSSGNYFWVAPILAFKCLIIATLIFEGMVYLSGFPGTLPELIVCQTIGALIGCGLGFIPVIRRWSVGRVRLAKNVDDQAVVSFLREGLTQTRDRTGVLIYISLFEHQVEILGDQGIHRHVGNEYWQGLSHELAQAIGQGELTAGLERTIQKVGAKLTEHFPGEKDGPNELADDLRKKE